MTADHWFEPLADHLGEAYLRYSFTRGTENEVDFLVDVLALGPGARVLDVGCGPGRHAHALGRRGIEVTGVDISSRFVELARRDAPEGVHFERLDARELAFESEFDAAISLCQGAFGLLGAGPGTSSVAPPGSPVGAGGRRVGAVDPDGAVVSGMARAVRPGGMVCLSAFSSYFVVRNLEERDTFDADRGVNHEWTSIVDEEGMTAEVDLWTSCFTPRELRLIFSAAGLELDELWSVTPGADRRLAPDLDHPEFLALGHRPEPGGGPSPTVLLSVPNV